MILERQREGIAKAKARGAYKERKPLSPELLERAKELHTQGKSLVTVAKELGCGKSTLYNYMMKI